MDQFFGDMLKFQQKLPLPGVCLLVMADEAALAGDGNDPSALLQQTVRPLDGVGVDAHGSGGLPDAGELIPFPQDAAGDLAAELIGDLLVQGAGAPFCTNCTSTVSIHFIQLFVKSPVFPGKKASPRGEAFGGICRCRGKISC